MNRVTMVTRRLVVVVSALLAAASLAGCSSVHHQPLPSVPLPAQWGMAEAPCASDRGPATASTFDWWAEFDDPVLEALIKNVLATNNDLAAAAIRVYRAQLQASLVGTNATSAATVGGNASVARALDSQTVFREGGLSGSVSYELDLWGKLAAQRDAAAWEVNATAADRDAARLSLIGTTAALYWRAGYLSEQLALTEAEIAYEERTLSLVRARYAAGAASELDVVQAEQGLSKQRAEQARVVQQGVENRHALAILFDRPPEVMVAQPGALPDGPLPSVPAGLPADLLGRRPDLRAAEARLRQSLANVDVARASFYPSFALTGSVGSASETLERVISNPIAALALGVVLPFVQWNTMQLRTKVSEARYEEAVVNFRQRLFVALAEVENALSARVQLEREGEQRTLSVAHARRAEALARVRFEASATDLQAWLDQQQVLREAQRAELANRFGRLENRVRLFLALGGGEG